MEVAFCIVLSVVYGSCFLYSVFMEVAFCNLWELSSVFSRLGVFKQPRAFDSKIWRLPNFVLRTISPCVGDFGAGMWGFLPTHAGIL